MIGMLTILEDSRSFYCAVQYNSYFYCAVQYNYYLYVIQLHNQ